MAAPGASIARRARFDVGRLLELHAAHPLRYPVLLESTATSAALGRYSMLLAFSGERLDLLGDGTLAGDLPVSRAPTFLGTLDLWWKSLKLPPSESGLPFTGGWFVYLGYELAREIEPLLARTNPSPTPLATALRSPAAFVVDHATDDAWLVAEAGHDALLDTMDRDLADLVAPKSPQPPAGPLIEGRPDEEEPREFLASVEAALAHVAAGDVYQANLSRAWRATVLPGVKPHHVYRRLREANPAPFAGLADLGSHAIVSSSPERLVEVRSGRISTRPIAGTRPRARSGEADRGLATELRQHPKEQAEHVMLIDLERNDLGRVCEPGTIEVSEFMAIESYAHVHHIVSNVVGTLRAGTTPGQCIAAVFPGGTITGCPKVRCMEIIRDLEREPRGVYTGSMGYLNRDGSMDLNILIRTVSMTGRAIVFRAGAGIVADSVPERELDETRAKARGLLAALEPVAFP